MGKLGMAAATAGIDSGFGLVGNLINLPFEMAREKRNYELQYQYNEKSAQNAFNRQVDFWNMQNAYNDPSAQMSRLRQAGLNPALMNGGVQGNTAGGLSSVNSGSVSNSSSQQAPMKIMSIAQYAMMLEQSGLINQQTKLYLQETANAEMQHILQSLLGKEQWLEIKDKARAMGYDIPDADFYDQKFGLGSTPSEDGISPTKTADDVARSEETRNLASAKSSESDSFYKDTLAAVENSLVSYRQQLLSMQANESEARAAQLRESANVLRKQYESLSLDNKRKRLLDTLNDFFGTDISSLSPEMIYKAGQYYNDFQNGLYTYESTIDAFTQAVNLYAERAIHISSTNSVSQGGLNIGFLGATMGIDFGSYSQSF